MEPRFNAECAVIAGLTRLDQPLAPPPNPDALDWDFILRTLLDNRLAGLAYWRLSSVKSHGWPPSVMQQIEPHFVTNQFANMLLLQEAGRVFTALHNADVQAIALKGISLIDTVYNIGARKLGDIDLLLAPAQAEQAIATLTALGYAPKTPYHPGMDHLDLVRPMGKQSIPIDLSWKFLHRSKFQETAVSRIEAVLQRCPTKRISGADVLVLDPIDQVMHIATHGVLHHDLNFLPGLVDIAALLLRTPDFDWAALERRASQCGLWRSTLVALGVLADFFDVLLPPPVNASWQDLRRTLLRGPEAMFLDRLWVFGAEQDAALKIKHGGLKRNLARFFWNQTLSDSVRDRLAGLFDHLWPTEERIRKTYGVNQKTLVWLMRLLHFPILFMLMCLFYPLLLLLRPLFGFVLLRAK